MRPQLPAPTESVEQCCVIAWWALYSRSKGIDERLLFSIPNGSNKSMGQAMKFKREGLRKGCPDLILAYPLHGFHGLFIELKRMGQKAREEQRSFHAALIAVGYSVHVCQGADAAIKSIEWYLDVKKPGLVEMEI